MGAPVAIALAFAAAPPAHAAKIEKLDKLGKEAHFAFVEQAAVARAQPRPLRARSASSPSVPPRAPTTSWP